MQFVFPVLFSVMIAMLFVDFYSLSRSARSNSICRNPRSPNPLQVLTPLHRHLRPT